jgi:hypothetical protein
MCSLQKILEGLESLTFMIKRDKIKKTIKWN